MYIDQLSAGLEKIASQLYILQTSLEFSFVACFGAAITSCSKTISALRQGSEYIGFALDSLLSPIYPLVLVAGATTSTTVSGRAQHPHNN